MLMMKKTKNLEFEPVHPKNVRLASVTHGISCLLENFVWLDTIDTKPQLSLPKFKKNRQIYYSRQLCHYCGFLTNFFIKTTFFHYPNYILSTILFEIVYIKAKNREHFSNKK
jgi:hypothetical protein